MQQHLIINHHKLKAAQSKAVIARYLGDSQMWQQACEAMKSAINHPWYRRGK
ncbi:host cell division inhibitory peptide Kil [Klebsiella sp. Ap-873]|nr:host cell division inhibitory peptide Kil [Klebsiella sp. Ap-873]